MKSVVQVVPPKVMTRIEKEASKHQGIWGLFMQPIGAGKSNMLSRETACESPSQEPWQGFLQAAQVVAPAPAW